MMRETMERNPLGAAILQGIVFGILFGFIVALTGKHHSVANSAVTGAIAALAFAAAMYLVRILRLRAMRRSR